MLRPTHDRCTVYNTRPNYKQQKDLDPFVHQLQTRCHGFAATTSRFREVELDHDNSPRALVDRGTGRFIFVDAEPGKYGLIAWEPMSSAPVPDPETGETLFFEVSADEVLDLGTLHFP